MESSAYQSLKLILLSFLPITKDAVHIYIGLIVFFLYIIIARKSIASFVTLIPIAFVSAAMEMLDLRDDWMAFGYMRWEASIHDLINTMLWPTLIVCFFKAGLIDIDELDND